MVGHTGKASVAAESSKFPVTPYVRLVPNGVDHSNGRSILKLTAMVSPKPDTKGRFTLENWSGDILTALRNGGWRLPIQSQRIGRLTETDGCSTMQPVGDSATFRAHIDRLASVYSDPVDGDANLKNAVALWRDTFGGDDEGRWRALSGLLAASGSSAGIQASDKMESGTRRLEAATPNSKGQIPGPTGSEVGWQVDGIYTDSHSQLAVLLEYDRANRILAQVGSINRNASRSTPDAKENGVAIPEAAESKTFSQGRKARLQGFYNGLCQNFERGRVAYDNCRRSDATNDPAQCVCPENGITVASLAQSALILNSTHSSKETQETLDAGIDAHGYVTTPQTAPSPDPIRNDRAQLREVVGQDFLSVQTNAVLARLYCLAFDLSIDLTDPENAAALRRLLPDTSTDSPAGDLPSRTGRVAFLIWMDTAAANGAASSDDGGGFGGADSPASLTTIAKTVISTDQLAEPGFWPATREEVVYWLTLPGDPVEDHVSQIDGYQLPGKLNAHRFELTSLDVRAAVEHEYMKRLSVAQSAPAASGQDAVAGGESAGSVASRSSSTEGARDKPLPSPMPTGTDAAFRTDGLVILDRWMQIEKARALARRQRMIDNQDPDQRQILYAEDLTIGYRLDVGVPGTRGPQWSPLNMRIVNYGLSSSSRWKETAVHNLLKKGVAGPLDEADRVNMDSSIITAPERMIPAPPEGEGGPRLDLAVAENLVTWQGPPLGVDMTGLSGPVDDRLEGGVELGATGLTFTRRHFLPLRGHKAEPGLPTHEELEAFLPHRLRFGWPYCFALRGVYSGGRSVPLAQVADTSARRGGRVVFPLRDTVAGEEPRYFRFLRQGTIGTPVVLLPSAEATSDHYGPMGVAENQTVILRSVEQDGSRPADIEGRAFPETASRVIVPPRVDLDEAARHGVFDRQSGEEPEGAFADFDMRVSQGSAYFPVAKRTVIRGMNGALLPADGWSTIELVPPASGTPGEVPAQAMLDGEITDVHTVYSGPIHNLVQGPNQGQKLHYYPDPFAHTLVLRIRYAGRDDRPELIHHVPIYPFDSNQSITELTRARPVRLNFYKAHGAGLRISDIAPNVRLGAVQLALQRARSLSSDTELQLYIALPAGNSFDLDLWYVPTLKDLIGKSAVVQAMAVIKSRASNSDSAGGKFVAPGGVIVPRQEYVRDVAEELHAALLRAPINGVTSATTLRCAHATNAVRDSIRLPSDPDQAPLLFHRANSVKYATWVEEKTEEATARRFASYIVDDSPDVVLDGDIGLDLNRISGFDILARAVDPSTETLDDMARARSLRARRDGTWPTLRDWGGHNYLKNARQIFGFDLARDGSVALPKVEFVLYRVRNLPTDLAPDDPLRANPRPEAAMPVSDLQEAVAVAPTMILLYKLLALADRLTDRDTDQAANPSARHIRVTRVQHFSGTLGRDVQLAFRPIPRTLGQLEVPDRNVRNSHILRNPFPPDDVIGTTNLVPCPLPSASRPATPALHGITYLFHWQGTGTPADPRIRETRIRIYMERGWFSKSDAERVGLVLWPPDQRRQDDIGKDTAQGSLPDPWTRRGRSHEPDVNLIHFPRSWSGGDREFQYLDYRDEDLGPNGRHVTRMGADPIKEAGFTARAFIGHDDMTLLGAATWSGKEGTVLIDRLVLPASQAGDSTGELEVSLLTAMPKFHAEREQWYFDLSFPREFATIEPFIRFGIVRYAADAPAALRASAPTSIWAKVMPRRTLTASLSPDGRLSVKLSGAALKVPVMPGDSGALHNAPAVYALLMAERVLNDKVIARRELLPLELLTSGGGRPVRPARRDAWLHLRPSYDPINGDLNAWHIEQSYDNPIQQLELDERLVVHVQEVDRFRPAQYPTEPLDPLRFETDHYEAGNIDDYLVETGPRFAGNVIVAEARVT